ncbi:MAG: acyl-CoA dehydrogenase family protein, partial [Steroidobacteraceae bacterium]
MEVETVRAHVMRTAWLIDTYGTKAARSEVAQCKVLAPNMALEVLDRAIQFHGGTGVAHSKPLAEMYAYQRVSRIGEGADEVHREFVAKFELARQRELRTRMQEPKNERAA